jgi:hemolysin III
MISFVLGGIIYIVGGIVFGVRRPDPSPKHFGYHEVFHVLTVLANLCFMIPIIVGYSKNTFF